MQGVKGEAVVVYPKSTAKKMKEREMKNYFSMLLKTKPILCFTLLKHE